MDNGGLRFVDGQQQRPFAHEEVVFCFYLMMTNRGEKNTWVGALSWRTSLLFVVDGRDLSIFVYSWRFNTVEVVVVVGGGDSI